MTSKVRQAGSHDLCALVGPEILVIQDSKMRGGPSAIGEGPCSELSVRRGIKGGERHDSLLVFLPATSSLTLSMAHSQMVRIVAFAVNLRRTGVTANLQCAFFPPLFRHSLK